MNFKSIISSIFGSKFSRDMKEIQPWVEKCKIAQESMKGLSNDELRERTIRLKAQIQDSVAEQQQKIQALRYICVPDEDSVSFPQGSICERAFHLLLYMP